MLILLVNINIKPEHIEAFREATTDNARNSRNEPGVVRFDFLQDTDNPAHFSLVEVYRDQDAVVAHKQTAHYLRWAEKTVDMFAEPRTRGLYRNVFPTDENW